jgi:hypothetical protein
MTRRYLVVLVFGLLGGLAIIVFARRAPDTSPASVEAPMETMTLAVRLLDTGVQVSDSVVAQGVVVHLTVENTSRVAVTLSLGGYEDRVHFESLAPGASDTASFVTDRPGERFPWLRDGAPTASLAVTGSHLVEGHK